MLAHSVSGFGNVARVVRLPYTVNPCSTPIRGHHMYRNLMMHIHDVNRRLLYVKASQIFLSHIISEPEVFPRSQKNSARANSEKTGRSNFSTHRKKWNQSRVARSHFNYAGWGRSSRRNIDQHAVQPGPR